MPAPTTTASTFRESVICFLPMAASAGRGSLRRCEVFGERARHGTAPPMCARGSRPSGRAGLCSRAEVAVDLLADVLQRPGGTGEDEQGEEAVHLTGEAAVRNGNPGRAQLLRVRLALVAQDVVLGGQHDGGR